MTKKSLLPLLLMAFGAVGLVPRLAVPAGPEKNLGNASFVTSYKLHFLGQTFVPGFGVLQYADLAVTCCSSDDPGTVVLQAKISDGSGNVVGLSSEVTLPNPTTYTQPVGPHELTRFSFGGGLGVTPGKTYVIELIHVAGGDGGWAATGNEYPDGTAIINGVADIGDDFMFVIKGK